MRIVSLLPSLTEIACELGLRESLVGVTHECDHPPGIERLPHLTRSKIAASASSAEIDAAVSAQGGSLYELDEPLLRSLAPDLILTQEQCDVCAVNERTVRRAAANLPGSPHVESVNPLDLAGVFEVVRTVGRLTDRLDAAETWIARYQAAVETVRRVVSGREPVRAVLLEWFDPPFCSGHWNPEIVAQAGSVELLARAGEASRRVTWDEIAKADPDAIILSPCGFTIERTRTELPGLTARPEWRGLRAVRDGRVTLVDGSAYFSRPGPRLLESLLIAAEALHPGRFPGPIPGRDFLRLDPI